MFKFKRTKPGIWLGDISDVVNIVAVEEIATNVVNDIVDAVVVNSQKSSSSGENFRLETDIEVGRFLQGFKSFCGVEEDREPGKVNKKVISKFVVVENLKDLQTTKYIPPLNAT